MTINNTNNQTMNGQEKKYQKYEELKNTAELGGGKDRIEKHHEAGKKTAREHDVRKNRQGDQQHQAIQFDRQGESGNCIRPQIGNGPFIEEAGRN